MVTITHLPTWTIEDHINTPKPERQALIDSETANQHISHLLELQTAATNARRENRPTADMLARRADALDQRITKTLTHCTNSGRPRTECDTCDHRKQLALAG